MIPLLIEITLGLRSWQDTSTKISVQVLISRTYLDYRVIVGCSGEVTFKLKPDEVTMFQAKLQYVQKSWDDKGLGVSKEWRWVWLVGGKCWKRSPDGTELQAKARPYRNCQSHIKKSRFFSKWFRSNWRVLKQGYIIQSILWESPWLLNVELKKKSLERK